MTPLQRKVSDLITSYERNNENGMSGREISLKIGKSRNHLSQILNDGLVPSGQVLLKLAELLGASEEQRNLLIRDAMRTKIAARARDAFWLEHALEMTESAEEKVDDMIAFLDENGLVDRYERWQAERDEKKKKDEAPQGVSPSSVSSLRAADDAAAQEG